MKNPKAHAFARKLAATPHPGPLSIADYEEALRMLVGAHLCATAPDLDYVQGFLAQLYASIEARWNDPAFIDRRAEVLTRVALETAREAAAAGKAQR